MKLFVLISAVALALAPPARGDKPRCRLERIDSTALDDGRLRLYASVVELEGDVDEGKHAGDFVLKIDGKPAGRAERLQVFEGTKEEVDVALVVETAAQYQRALDKVRDALKDFLVEQPASMKVTLITFGSDLGEPSKLIGAPLMSGELDKLSADDDSVDVRMTDAILNALGELKKVEPKEDGRVVPRRLIVLVSDGLNAKMDRATFKKIGTTAAQAGGVPIHAIAFSPIDERGPLLNLGELSKRSNGTFRWARTADDLEAQLKTLADEVRKQYVLTFKTSLSSTERHTFQLQCGGELHSNRLGGKGQLGIVAASKSGLAWYWWVLIVLGALAGVYLIFGIVLTIRGGAGRARGTATPTPVRPVEAPAARAAGGAGGGVAAGGRSALLIAVTGALSGDRFPVVGAITVGKAPGHGVTVPGDGSVSSNHFEIRADGVGFVIRDLASTNGTFVNGRRIAEPQRLSDGDLVRCGADTQFKFRVE